MKNRKACDEVRGKTVPLIKNECLGYDQQCNYNIAELMTGYNFGGGPPPQGKML